MHTPEGSMRQSCWQHSKVRRNAEIKLVCSESYYDRLLLYRVYAADQSGRRLPRSARLVQHAERTFRKIWKAGLVATEVGYPKSAYLYIHQRLLAAAITHEHPHQTPI